MLSRISFAWATTSYLSVRRRRNLVWFGAIAIIVALAYVTTATWLPWFGEWLAVAPHLQRADAIVVLGGGPERADHAAALYRQGFGGELWITGEEPGSAGLSTNTRSLAEHAIAGGVPTQVIHFLASTSTWEDGREVARLVRERKIGSILVVTDWYHSRRALCVLRQQLDDSRIRTSYDPPPDPIYGPRNWWPYSYRRDSVLEEYAKLAFYSLRYGLKSWTC